MADRIWGFNIKLFPFIVNPLSPNLGTAIPSPGGRDHSHKIQRGFSECSVDSLIGLVICCWKWAPLSLMIQREVDTFEDVGEAHLNHLLS